MERITEPTWGLPADVDSTDWERMASVTPRHYVCHFTPNPPIIDGRLDDPAWSDATWTEPFVDIEGERGPEPRFDTRVAMRWDDDFLYVAARMDDPHVWGTITEPNSVIYLDKDFEVFIDPDGDNHNYYELEINALNTIWELTLEKPYRDGGPVYSPTHLPGLRTAVHVEGTLNAPHDTDIGWSVELALPWDGLSRHGYAPPADGDRWRINFSRVHWEHEIVDNAYRKQSGVPEHNWVWSPQGVVDMHRPERWGYVQFSRSQPGEASFRTDPTLRARDTLMAVYYAQKAYKQHHGRWADDLSELDVRVPEQADLHVQLDGWTATLPVSGHGALLQVDHESRLQIMT
ncbi:MAG: sugar-binding protein [Rhodothermales bacterium]